MHMLQYLDAILTLTGVFQVGQLIYIDDGLLSLKVKEKKDSQSLLCHVMNGGG